MKELHKFIMNKTNVESYFDPHQRPHEYDENKIKLRIWDQVLNPCGMPRWMLNHYYHHPQFKRAEHIAISLEENLIHPIIAIWVTKQKMVEVFESLHNIQMEILNQLDTTMVM